MKLQIMQIDDRGIPNKERLWIRVLADTNLKFYVVIDTVYISPNTVSNSPKHTFWFVPTPVKAGDNIILYTGAGKATKSRNASGGTDHFFFWNLPNIIWRTPGSCAVLFEVNDWQTTKHE